MPARPRAHGGATSDVTASPAGAFQAPSIEYCLLSPMLIVFGVAARRRARRGVRAAPARYLLQSVLAIVGLVAAWS